MFWIISDQILDTIVRHCKPITDVVVTNCNPISDVLVDQNYNSINTRLKCNFNFTSKNGILKKRIFKIVLIFNQLGHPSVKCAKKFNKVRMSEIINLIPYNGTSTFQIILTTEYP